MPMIEAGIFDAGGVLVENPDVQIQQDVRETLGLNEKIFLQAWNELKPQLQKGVISEKEFWRRFLNLTKPKRSLPNGESLLTRQARLRFSPIYENLELVKTLKNTGLKLAVLSNTEAPIVELWGKLGIYDNFDIRVFSNEVGLRKPDLDIFVICMEKLKVNSAFFVDDSKDNFPPGLANLGIIPIHAQNPVQLRKELVSLGVGIR